MDRRKFFTGVGSLAAAGAAAKLWQSDGEDLTARGAKASGGVAMHASPAHAPSFARLAGSEEFICAQLDSPVNQMAYKLGLSSYARAAVSILGYEASAESSLQTLDIVVNYQLAEPPYQAPFYAFRLRNAPGTPCNASQPVGFEVATPDGATLGLSYRLREPRGSAAGWGAMSFALGGFGLGPGLYVLAGLSSATGAAPILDLYTWAEIPGKIAHRGGEPIDFDYVCLALTPARA